MQRSFSSVTLGLALIACGGGESGTSEASSPSSEATASTSTECTDASGGFTQEKWIECAPLDTVEIALVNAGEGEKKELRLNAESGHTESNRMSMDISMSMGMGPMGEMDMDLPTMMIDMTTEVVETLPNGNIKSNINSKIHNSRIGYISNSSNSSSISSGNSSSRRCNSSSRVHTGPIQLERCGG